MNADQTSLPLEAQLDQLWTLINRQQVKPALAACRQFNQRYPNSDDGWFASSFLAFQLRNGPQALALIDKALAIAAAPRWQLHKAHILAVLGGQSTQYREQALALADGLSQQSWQDPDFCAELALVLNKLSRFEGAKRHYQLAIALTPANAANTGVRAQLLFNLGSIERYLGHIDAAVDCLDQAITLDETDAEAHLLRASLKTQTLDNNHIAQLQKLIAQMKSQNAHPLALTQLYYALAKELEDVADYPASFSALSQGATVRRQHMQYDLNQDIATIEQIIKTYDSETFNGSIQGFDTQAPIFILGLPRTGSTLIERIVGNHTEVHSAGELNNFALQMVQLCGKQPDKAAMVTASRQLDFAVLGQQYINSTKPDTEQAAHFIDKLPLNSLYAGLIRLALPQAKIIYVKRHPLDVCYAMYKQLFTNGYPFSYDLTELAQYYIAHHRLMSHWQQVLGQGMYTVAYEDVVDDVQAQAQGLIEYCGLDWQPQCAAFEKNTAPSTTASASQVRQGIYNRSKYRWRELQPQLAPVKVLLEGAGIHCD